MHEWPLQFCHICSSSTLQEYTRIGTNVTVLHKQDMNASQRLHFNVAVSCMFSSSAMSALGSSKSAKTAANRKLRHMLGFIVLHRPFLPLLHNGAHLLFLQPSSTYLHRPSTTCFPLVFKLSFLSPPQASYLPSLVAVSRLHIVTWLYG